MISIKVVILTGLYREATHGRIMRTIFIGDVHGCVDELQKLVGELNLQENDQIVFVGDLLHKGPSSEKVLEFVLKLKSTYTVDLICGNHEEKHLRWLSKEEQIVAFKKENPTGYIENKMEHVEEYPSIAISNQSRELMSSSYIAKQYSKYTVVHAGIPGNLRKLEYLTYQQWLEAKGKSKNALGQVMRVRFLAGPGKTSTNKKGKIKEVAEGSMLALGEQQSGDPYWANIYDGRFGKIIFGHNPFMQDTPMVFPHAIGIDLGCVHGGYLCALIIDGDVISHKVVKAAKEYAKRPSWVYEN